MPEGLPALTVTDFFADQPPLTGTGSLRLADALAATGREAEYGECVTVPAMSAAGLAQMLGRNA